MSQECLKHYVQILSPGFLEHDDSIRDLPQTSTMEVPNRDSNVVNLPKEAYAFRFFDRQEFLAQDGEVLVGQPRNYSNKIYFGEKFTLEHVQEKFPDSKLITDMIANGNGEAVRTEDGMYHPLGNGDLVLSR